MCIIVPTRECKTRQKYYLNSDGIDSWNTECTPKYHPIRLFCTAELNQPAEIHPRLKLPNPDRNWKYIL